MTELLAPAGGREALTAAVQNGADAVYLGLDAFSARAGAQNFTKEALREAVAYCHLYGVKVYLTLNTLLTDRELPAAEKSVRAAAECGVDAVLVQDWGVWELLRRVAPDLPVHASTQMSLHTRSGVSVAAEQGAARAVLARELRRDEIAEICEKSPIEIEVFAHGALCMCYSGQCEMSAVIGGRSGNRGQCAQPCRLPYGFHGKADRYPLSLKDSCLAEHLGELCEMGVACIKLEGRMKRPEYVAAVTSVYARLLREKRKPTPEELRQLDAAFSRDGFTQGYFLGEHGRKMFGTRSENAHWPEDWFAELRRLYEKENLRTVPVGMDAVIRTGQPMSLTVSDKEHRVVFCGDTPEIARTRAITREEIIDRLGKTGATAFAVADCTVELDDGLSVSAASLNALRRGALALLEQERTKVAPCSCGTFSLPPFDKTLPAVPALTVSLVSAAQLSPALIALAPARILLPIEALEQVDFAQYPAALFCAVLPRIYRTRDEAALRSSLIALKNRGVQEVALGNLGHFALCRDLGLVMHGDFGLNVYNSAALIFLSRLGLRSATLSFELRHEQIRDIRKYIPCEAIVYGRLPLMLTENCIVENDMGHRCEEMPRLQDRRGEQFPVLKAFGCRSEIQNGKTLFLADKPEWRTAGLTSARLRFTTESAQECARVLRAYCATLDASLSSEEKASLLAAAAPRDLTRGLFYRGVI